VRTKPLIAVVEGAALGGGFEIVLCCDLVVASESATFGLPEAAIGVLPIYGGLARAPGRLPLNVVAELALTATPLPAASPQFSGFVNVLTAPGDALEGALKLARRISSNAPVPVRETLRILHTLTVDERQRWELTREARERVAGSGDLEEAARAKAEGRAPRWHDI
jgi:enoyl-CoA hydratase/carnithine racemase